MAFEEIRLKLEFLKEAQRLELTTLYLVMAYLTPAHSSLFLQ